MNTFSKENTEFVCKVYRATILPAAFLPAHARQRIHFTCSRLKELWPYFSLMLPYLTTLFMNFFQTPDQDNIRRQYRGCVKQSISPVNTTDLCIVETKQKLSKLVGDW